TQIAGNAERGTLEILRQLQGFEIPASAWEREVLSRRISSYDPKVLDQLSLTGAIGWGRLSPHPATLEDSSDGRRRVIPTSVAPITFFVREESDWMLLHHNTASDGTQPDKKREASGLSAGAREVLEFLRTRGASFFTDIVRATGRLKSEVETALWELVAAGMITADGFDNLRALIDPRRRTGEVRGGRFVSGFIGEQFALPVAVESLRAMRNAPPSEETITISAADPLNLVGIIVPGERVPAISGKFVSFRNGVAAEGAAVETS